MAIATAYVPTSMPSQEVWFGNVLVANSSSIIISDGFRKTEYFGTFSYSIFGEVFGTLEVVNEFRGGELIYSVTNIGANASQIYQAVQILANFDLSASIVLEKSDTFNGSSGGDTLRSYSGNDFVYGFGGNDALEGMGDNDIIDGGAGIDTALYSGAQASYTLTLSPTATALMDRRADGNGTDTLIDIELLDFDTGTFSLNQFGGTTGLSEQNFESFIELYIAYFNRAPDAIGLNFWGTAFANGTTLEEMATLFVGQDETLAAYPAGTSNNVFAETVYNNVLGRTPDQAGFDFWVGQLDTGSVSRDQFILNVLQGAKSDLKPELGPDFVTQQLADQAYLEDKIDIGAYFAIHKGMSDVTNASDAMTHFDGTQIGKDNAVAAIDDYHTAALDPVNGEFLMQVVGVLDDPFAGV